MGTYGLGACINGHIWTMCADYISLFTLSITAVRFGPGEIRSGTQKISPGVIFTQSGS